MKWAWRHTALVLVLLLGLALSLLTASYAYQTNGEFGFPLDDPWIHLQFAKNLHDFGSFSYFKDQTVTSGSTAPLYTILLALGFFLSSNEMVLSYVFGVLFFLVGGIFFFRLARESFPTQPSFVLAGTLLVMAEPRLHWIALSGMETTMFIALLLAVTYYYWRHQPVAAGVFSGLLLWTRPEAVILFGVIAVDMLNQRYVIRSTDGKQPSREHLTKALAILVAMGAAYAIFNSVLSGSLLPNTYAAKLKYYSAGGGTFPGQVFHYLVDGPMLVISIFVGIGAFSVLRSLFSRENNPFLIPLLFSFALFLAYWMKLPYLYQNGRYMMPVLPFIILVGLYGLERTVDFLGRHVSGFTAERTRTITVGAVLTVMSVQFVLGTWESRALYQDFCRYIGARQVKTAKWIRDHLPSDAVVATHDIGAIAFYSERRVVDMVGLISPSMIEHIGNLNGLTAFLTQQGATHLAVLRNWFEVVNVNPVFQTDERFPEIMEVFDYEPMRLHFTSKEANWLTDNGWRAVAAGSLPQGGPMLEEAVRRDPRSSRAHFLLGKAFFMVGHVERAEKELATAIELHPTLWEARLEMARVMAARRKPREAIRLLEDLVGENPSVVEAYQMLGEAYMEFDRKKAEKYLVEYQALIRAKERSAQ